MIITDYLTVYAVFLSVLVDASNMHAMHELVENYYFLFLSKTCFLTQPKSGLIFKTLLFAILKKHSYYIFLYLSYMKWYHRSLKTAWHSKNVYISKCQRRRTVSRTCSLVWLHVAQERITRHRYLLVSYRAFTAHV